MSTETIQAQNQHWTSFSGNSNGKKYEQGSHIYLTPHMYNCNVNNQVQTNMCSCQLYKLKRLVQHCIFSGFKGDYGTNVELGHKGHCRRRRKTISRKEFCYSLCFKYSDIPEGKYIYVKELHSNIVDSLSIPQYVHIHQSNSSVVRIEYIEVQEIDPVSYWSLHT